MAGGWGVTGEAKEMTHCKREYCGDQKVSLSSAYLHIGNTLLSTLLYVVDVENK